MQYPDYAVGTALDFCMRYGTPDAMFTCLKEAQDYAKKLSRKHLLQIEVRRSGWFSYSKIVSQYQKGIRVDKCQHCGRHSHDKED